MALVDLETEVKPWLEIAPSVTTSDNVLLTCMESATAFFESYCERELEEDTYTHQFNGSGRHELRLREFPVSDIHFAAIDSTWAFATPEDLASILIDNELWLVRKEIWPHGIRNIQVSYTAGYDFDDTPTDLRLACLQMVEFLYHGRADHRVGVTNRSKIGETLTFQDSVPKTILDLIAPYRRKGAVAALVRRQGG